MSTYRPGDTTPVRGRAHLREVLAPGEATPGRLGLEWEMLPVGTAGRLVPYAGPGGVEGALENLAGRGYTVAREGGRAIGATAPTGAFVGLEPGGQVEVATPPADRLDTLARELGARLSDLEAASEPSGWSPRPWGLAPHDGPEDLPDVPKARYAILGEHLRRKGRLGRRMMKLTASTQFSLDTPGGEEGLRRQVDGALRLLPYLVGWLANSPVSLGRRGRWKSWRPHIWAHTDRSRCGLPSFLFGPLGGSSDRWAEYYLSREVLFYVRGGEWRAGGGRTFRSWLAEPGADAPVTLEDWSLQISGVFTDLRYRGYLEIRVADSVPLPLAMAGAALCKGLLGDPGRIGSWRRLLPDPEPAQTRADLLRAASGGGLWEPLRGPTPGDLAPGLLRCAREGLRAFGEDGGWLAPIESGAAAGTCPADGWKKVRRGGWTGPGARGGRPL